MILSVLFCPRTKNLRAIIEKHCLFCLFSFDSYVLFLKILFSFRQYKIKLIFLPPKIIFGTQAKDEGRRRFAILTHEAPGRFRLVRIAAVAIVLGAGLPIRLCLRIRTRIGL